MNLFRRSKAAPVEQTFAFTINTNDQKVALKHAAKLLPKGWRPITTHTRAIDSTRTEVEYHARYRG